MKKYLFAVLFFTINLYLLLSCNKTDNSQNANYSDKSIKVISTENLHLKFYNTNNSFNSTLIDNVTITYKECSGSVLDSICNNLTSPNNNISFSDKNTVTKIIVYGDTSPLVNNRAISFINRTSTGIYFRHYVKTSTNNYSLLQDSVIKFSSFFDRDLIALLMMDSNYSNIVKPTIEVITKESIQSSTFNYEKPLSASLIKMNVEYLPFAPIEEGYCKRCGGGKSGECKTNEVTNEKYCSDGNCRLSIIDSAKTIDRDSVYRFRDDELHQTNLGKEYTAYYEYISYIINSYEKPSSISSSEQIDFLFSTLATAYILQFGQNSDTLVTQNYYDKATSYIDKYKTFIPNQYFNDVLDKIVDDLDLYKGKTRSYVKSHIQ